MEKNLPYRTIGFSILGNILLAIVKIAAGILGNSYALVADGIESVSDVFFLYIGTGRAQVCTKAS